MAMSENLKEHVEEQLKVREEAKDEFVESRTIYDEAHVILEANGIQEEALRSFCQEAGNWDDTRRPQS